MVAWLYFPIELINKCFYSVFWVNGIFTPQSVLYWLKIVLLIQHFLIRRLGVIFFRWISLVFVIKRHIRYILNISVKVEASPRRPIYFITNKLLGQITSLHQALYHLHVYRVLFLFLFFWFCLNFKIYGVFKGIKLLLLFRQNNIYLLTYWRNELLFYH